MSVPSYFSTLMQFLQLQEYQFWDKGGIRGEGLEVGWERSKIVTRISKDSKGKSRFLRKQ